jgi:quinoprotein glucose dehydrogenase
MKKSLAWASVNRRILGILLIGLSLIFIAGGLMLVIAGGSLYYLLAGLSLAVSGILTWRADRRGLWWYGVLLVGTMGWAVAEVGLRGWLLVPRLVAPFVLGSAFLVPAVSRNLAWPTSTVISPRFRGLPTFCVGLVAAFGVGLGLHSIGPADPTDPLYRVGAQEEVPGARPFFGSAPQPSANGDWLAYGNDGGGTRFSPLSQLNSNTVTKLKLAWTVHVGPASDGNLPHFEGTPLKVGPLLYACTGYNDVLAIDAETGTVKWRFRSGNKMGMQPAAACRGLAYYAVQNATGLCSRRVYTNTIDARLIALDADTGQLCPGFGVNGQVNLLKGMSTAPRGYYYVSSAPTQVRGKIVLGGWVSDGQYWGEPSGVIRGFDAVTGKLSWAFDMGRPGEHGEPKPGQFYSPATPNSWAPMSADEALGLVYAPTGNATPDYYGAQRRPFDDKYSSSVLAIDAETGKLRWSFQTVHHDLFDYDVASQPTLVDIPSPGGVQRALLQPTKQGEVYVLDRVTGKPLKSVAELPVSRKGGVAGERLSPTQPFSVGMPGFRGPDLREKDMWGVTPIDQLWCRIKFKRARYDGPMTPPGLTPNVIYPGYLGGMDWGSVSVDRDRNIMIVNSSRVPNVDQLLPRNVANKMGLRRIKEGGNGDVAGAHAQEGTPYAADVRPFLSPFQTPCNAPPYGLITAVDLTTGKVVWSHPLGTARDSGPFGIPSMLPITMGLPNSGGSLTTRGGLVFIAASQERTLRALDVRTGKEVWSARLPAGGHATPMTYISERSGRQFIVISAGGNVPLRSKTGDAIVAYALPK